MSSEPNDLSRVLRLLITSTPQGISDITLGPWPEEEFSRSGVYMVRISLQGDSTFQRTLPEDLKAYFCGQPVSFLNYPVDWQGTTPFVRKVLESARSIPWGETQSYGWLSEQLKLPGGARAVGGALGRNSVPVIIPCHRILRKDGQLGGFSAGIPWKNFLLDLEGRASIKTLSPLIEY